MAPGNLKKFALTQAVSNMRAGFEAELILPGEYNEDGESELDFDRDEPISQWHLSLGDIQDFFSEDSPRARVFSTIEEEYHSWASEKASEWIEDQIQERIDYLQGEDEELNDEDARQQAWDELYTEFYQDLDSNDASMKDWCNDQGWEYYSDIYNNFSLSWPHHKNMSGFANEVNNYAYTLQKLVGGQVEVNDEYHSESKNTTSWYLEPDPSISPDKEGYMGVELVSPPMPVLTMLNQLKKVLAWASDNGGFTNSTTGFHVGVSLAGLTTANVDYVKLALFLGDQYVLQQFGRAANTYTKSSIHLVQKAAARKDMHDIAIDLDNMRRGLITDAGRNILTRNSDKYFSINMKDKYIEFRSMGGDYMNQIDMLTNTILRYIRAYAVACDPNAERQEYAKKLSKLLNPTNADQLTPFVQFAMGGLDKQSLISSLKIESSTNHQFVRFHHRHQMHLINHEIIRI